MDDPTSSVTMASAMELLTTLASDAQNAGLPLGNFVVDAKSLIAEAEQHMTEKKDSLLPADWAQKFYAIIDKAEAQIKSEQVSQLSKPQHRQSGGSCSKQEVSYSSTEVPHPQDGGVDVADDTRNSSNSAILAELSNHHLHQEQKFVLAEFHSMLTDVQQDVHALVPVIQMSMAEFRALKKNKTSELAWFSILEEEYGILVDLNNHIEDLRDPVDDLGKGLAHEIIQHRFDALPVQLHAVFNMQCQEAEHQGSEIDDEEMVRMVLENQKRTEMLRNIQDMIKRTQDIVHQMEKVQ